MENLADKATNIVRIVIISMLVILGVYIFARYLLPLILIAGVGIFLYIKIKGHLNKSSKSDNDNIYYSNINSSAKTQADDDLDGDIVDVDYKDV